MKNDGHFQISHPLISLKQFSNICKNVVYFFYYVGGLKNDQGFSKKKKRRKKMVSLQLPHTVISNSEKLTHPAVYACTVVNSILVCTIFM